MYKIFIKIFSFLLLCLISIRPVYAEIINEIEVNGNNRISSATIILFSDAKINKKVDENDLNKYLKNLYETNFFKNIEIKIRENTLFIFVEEEPLIQNVKIGRAHV